MNFYEVIKKRKSIRKYQTTAIPDESIIRIAEAVQAAPSACNLQPWKVLFIKNKDVLEKIYGVYDREWLRNAPAIAVILGCAEDAWKRLEGTSIIDVDIAIAMEHLVLAATAEGLGTCWICAYQVAAMNRVLGIDSRWNALAITPVGYIEAEGNPVKHKDVNDIFEVLD